MINWSDLVRDLPKLVKLKYGEMNLDEKYDFLKVAISPFDDYEKSIKSLCKFLEY